MSHKKYESILSRSFDRLKLYDFTFNFLPYSYQLNNLSESSFKDKNSNVTLKSFQRGSWNSSRRKQNPVMVRNTLPEPQKPSPCLRAASLNRNPSSNSISATGSKETDPLQLNAHSSDLREGKKKIRKSDFSDHQKKRNPEAFPSKVSAFVHKKILKAFSSKTGYYETQGRCCNQVISSSTKHSSFKTSSPVSKKRQSPSPSDAKKKPRNSLKKHLSSFGGFGKDSRLDCVRRFSRKRLNQNKFSVRNETTIQPSMIRYRKVISSKSFNLDVVDGFPKMNQQAGFFGRPLQDICDANGVMPHQILTLLQELLERGPQEVGIFRKSANVRVVRKLKEKLDKDEEISDINKICITAVASLLKDFFRCLPDCILGKDLYDEWLEVSLLPGILPKKEKILELCSSLPPFNMTFLIAFLYVLNRISAKAETNMMTSMNLATCVGPSILWSSIPGLDFDCRGLETIQFMIDNVLSIFEVEETLSVLTGIMLSPSITPIVEQTAKLGVCNLNALLVSGVIHGNESLSPTSWKSLSGSGRGRNEGNLSRDSGISLSSFDCKDEADFVNHLPQIIGHSLGQ